MAFLPTVLCYTPLGRIAFLQMSTRFACGEGNDLTFFGGLLQGEVLTLSGESAESAKNDAASLLRADDLHDVESCVQTEP